MNSPITSLRVVVVLTTAILMAASLSCDQIEIYELYDRGMVVTADPIASEIGKQVLADGGNAFDAAVAVGFALAVVYPEAGNIGGGGFALLRDAAHDTVHALDFREIAPATAFETMYLDQEAEVIPDASTYGALAAGVPGTVAGLHEIWRQFGSLGWSALLAPAIMLADSGFTIEEGLATSLAENRVALAGFPATAAQFMPGGRLPRTGELFKQPDLGHTLRLIAQDERAGFYTGETAEKIQATMEANGGLITIKDLAAYEVTPRDPQRFRFDSLQIFSMPPPSSGGICLEQILRLLEPFDLTSLRPTSPQYLHLFCEAARLAFADRAEHLGDPDFVAIPDQLVSETYLDQRRTQINPDKARASESAIPGDPNAAESDQTTHYSICDKAGNMVAITYTLNTAFGSKLVVEGAGFLLNNEMDDFSIKPGHANVYGLVGGEANKIEPRKRMLSSMSPTLILLDSQPFMVLGSPGGSRIITTVAQAIISHRIFGLKAHEIVELPRFHHQWLPDILYVEKTGFDIDVRQDLIGRGHNVQEREPYGDLQLIAITPAGLMSGASDPRGRGSVAGLGTGD